MCTLILDSNVVAVLAYRHLRVHLEAARFHYDSENIIVGDYE